MAFAIKKCKTEYKNILMHDFRNYDNSSNQVNYLNKHIDSTKSSQNRYTSESSAFDNWDKYDECIGRIENRLNTIYETRKNYGISNAYITKPETVRLLEISITPDRQFEGNKEKQVEYLEKSISWLRRTFQNNFMSFQIHVDEVHHYLDNDGEHESMIHLHAQILPIVEDKGARVKKKYEEGKIPKGIPIYTLSAKQVTSRKNLIEYQRSFKEYIEEEMQIKQSSPKRRGYTVEDLKANSNKLLKEQLKEMEDRHSQELQEKEKQLKEKQEELSKASDYKRRMIEAESELYKQQEENNKLYEELYNERQTALDRYQNLKTNYDTAHGPNIRNQLKGHSFWNQFFKGLDEIFEDIERLTSEISIMINKRNTKLSRSQDNFL